MRLIATAIFATIGITSVVSTWNALTLKSENQRLREESVPLACQAYCLNHSAENPRENSLLENGTCYCKMPDGIYRPFALKPTKDVHL